MWKYYTSEINVFWNNDTLDKPSKEFLNNINWTEQPNPFNVNNEFLEKFLINMGEKDITLIKCVNIDTNDVLYYFQNRIVRKVNNLYQIEYILDYWLTYTLELTQKDVVVLAERHQDYDDDKCLEFYDEVLLNNELSFNEFKTKNNSIEPKINKLGFIVDDFDINLNYCLVLSDSDNPNSAYTYIPFLKKSGTTEFTQKIPSNYEMYNQNSKLTINLNSTQIENNDWLNNPDLELDKTTFYFPKNKNVKVWTGFGWNNSLNKSKFRITSEFNNFDTTELFDIDKIFDEVKNKKNLVLKITLRKELVNDTAYIKCSIFDENELNELFFIRLNFDWNNKPEFVNFDIVNKLCLVDNNFQEGLITVHNSVEEINKLIKDYQSSTKVGNKVMGVYVTPNINNFDEIWGLKQINNKDYLILDIPQHGHEIPKMILDDWIKIEDDYNFDLEVPIHKNIYKYYDYYYFGTKLDVSKNLVKMTNLDKYYQLEFGDFLIFTNSFNIINKNKLTSFDARLLSMPAQQPFAIDTYNQYIQANMNSANMGYQIQKQQSIKNGVMSVINGSFSMAGNILTGNIAGAVQSGVNTISGVADSILSVSNYEKQVKAKYADADSTMGNNLLFSATEDALWNYDLNFGNINNQYGNTIWVKELTPDSIKQLNNSMLLFGVYNPKYINISQLPQTTLKLGFRYVKLDKQHLLKQFTQHINLNWDMKSKILIQLQEFRMWDKIPDITKQ